MILLILSSKIYKSGVIHNVIIFAQRGGIINVQGITVYQRK